jgi:hypothetical protein
MIERTRVRVREVVTVWLPDDPPADTAKPESDTPPLGLPAWLRGTLSSPPATG